MTEEGLYAPCVGRRRIRTLWLIKGLYPGGAQHLLEALLRAIDRDRIDVELAYVRTEQDRLVPRLRDTGIPVHDLGASNDLDLRWVWRLHRLLRRGRFDLLHVHSPLTGAVTRLAVRGTPQIYTEHNLWDAYRLPTRLANAATIGMNDAVVCVSHAVANRITAGAGGNRRSKAPTIVLYHGFDDAAVVTDSHARQLARERLGIPHGGLVFGMVAGTKPEKNHALLVTSFARVAADLPEAVLVLVGDGPCTPLLREQVSDLDLQGRVLVLGERHDVAELLPGFDVFTLSSDVEGLPVALLEAMAAGVPAVATDVGGTREVLRNDVDGYLVPPRDPDALACAMLYMADAMRRSRLGAAARSRAAEFSCRTAARSLADLYEHVAGAVPKVETIG